MAQLMFRVTEDDLDGGYSASALRYGIHTQGETIEELHRNVMEAVDCYFDPGKERPKQVRLHIVRDEGISL